MLIIELNEFSYKLLSSIASKCSLPSISRLLAMQHAKTTAEETEERHGLDPWVQWVSIHTGQPATKHGIAHLGDAYKLKYEQLWEALAKQGFRYGVWGCMNAAYRENKNCDFFFPDPWTFSERSYPENLNKFLALPRYYAKNYLDLSLLKIIKTTFQTVGFLSKYIVSFLTLSPFIINNILKSGINSASIFAVFDLINAVCFSKFRNKYKSDFVVIFLNSIAHYQHHCWPENECYSKKDFAIFRILDKALELILSTAIENEAIIFTNAFSQKNTKNLNETLYRQKNPEIFFNAIGLDSFRLEQLMTNDSQLVFSTEEDCNKAEIILNSLKINNKKAFQVDRETNGNLIIFCQFTIWEPIHKETKLIFGKNKSLEFYKYFDAVVQRTGSHLQEGDIYFQGIIFPERIKNFEIFSYVLNHHRAKIK